MRDDQDPLAAAPARARAGIAERVRSLHAHATAENHLGRPRSALRSLRRAEVLLGADWGTAEWRELAARIWITRATSQFELHGASAGMDVLAEAERLTVGAGMPSVEVVVHLQRGYFELHAGNPAGAVGHLDRAEALHGYADTATHFGILMNRGTANLYLGDLRRARGDLHRAVAVAAEQERPAYERMARHNLGFVEYLAGNLALALDSMRQAAEIAPDVPDGVSLLDRSRVLLDAGLSREADDLLVEAGELFTAERMWKDVGLVEIARAQCALLNDDVPLARRLAGRARDRFRRRGDTASRRAAELVLLQADIAAGRPGARLAPPAKRVMLEFQAAGLISQARTAQLIAAEALLRADRPDDAADTLASRRRDATDPIAVRLYDDYVRARLARRRGDHSAARRFVRKGLDELAAYQASFGGIDLQSGSAVHGRRLAGLGVEMALTDGRPAALLEAVERGRATSTRLIPVESPGDEETAALLADLRRSVEVVRAAEADADAGDLRAKRERIAHLQSLLRARSWHADGSGQTTRAVTAAEITAGLAAQDAELLCYVQVGGELHAISADRRGSLRVRALGPVGPIVELSRRVRADLDVIAGGRLPGALVAAVHRSLARSLQELDAALIAPVIRSDGRVLVLPTGSLAMLPWGNLPTLAGRPVMVAPSGSAWLSASAHREAKGPVRVEVFAGPALKRADEEARSVARLWPEAQLRVGADARQDPLVDAFARATIVHVAAHGEHQAENPLFSSLRLADGPVYAYELDQHARAADHVVLSACELGQATIRPGDEALGLTSVLLHLGTRSVVAGVARVNDDVAAEVMVRYHSALAAGVDSAQALADACAAEVDLPAPFVCFGGHVRFEPAAVRPSPALGSARAPGGR